MFRYFECNIKGEIKTHLCPDGYGDFNVIFSFLKFLRLTFNIKDPTVQPGCLFVLFFLFIIIIILFYYQVKFADVFIVTVNWNYCRQPRLADWSILGWVCIGQNSRNLAEGTWIQDKKDSPAESSVLTLLFNWTELLCTLAGFLLKKETIS